MFAIEELVWVAAFVGEVILNFETLLLDSVNQLMLLNRFLNLGFSDNRNSIELDFVGFELMLCN